MQPIERSIRIGAPLDIVWRLLTEIDRLPERMPHVLAITRISGPGFGVGTRWTHKSRPLHAKDVTTEWVVEVIGYSEKQFFVQAIDTPLARSVNGYDFAAQGPMMTELRAVAQMQPRSLWSRLAIWASARNLARATDHAMALILEEVKRAAERLHAESDAV